VGSYLDASPLDSEERSHVNYHDRLIAKHNTDYDCPGNQQGCRGRSRCTSQDDPISDTDAGIRALLPGCEWDVLC
jgi:hypothetical protein